MKYTKLVNFKNPYSWKEEKRQVLVSYQDIDGNEIWIEEKTLQSFLLLQSFLKEKGMDIGITSAYRSVEEQEILFQKRMEEVGLEETKKYVASPFYSEHHTGLALDIAVKIEDVYLEEANEQTIPLLEEIHSYLSSFGFILRYPKEKESITGFSYEPWHIRYVGNIPAMMMEKYHLCLEEYVEDFGGVLYIFKEAGMTSFDVVQEVSRLFGISKVGHTGTLDPMAKGVLLVAVGKATKIVELLTSKEKEYVAKARLGLLTDTGDITGKIVKEEKVESSNLPYAIASFPQTYLQEVPIYSAVKVHGKKLYEYAREGKEVALPKKEVHIYEIELLEQNGNDFTFRTLVSKGCFIRSLIQDIAASIGTIATMTDLLRTKQGSITAEECVSLQDIQRGEFEMHRIPDVFKEYPLVQVDEVMEKKIRNGNSLTNFCQVSDFVLFQNAQGKLLGIYQEKNGELVVYKNFCTNS